MNIERLANADLSIIYIDNYKPMTLGEILEYGRLRSYVDSYQFTDNKLLPFANVRYHIIENALTQLKEDFFYDVLTTNVQANQQRYVMKSSSATLEGVKKVLNTYIKWNSGDQYPTKITMAEPNVINSSLEELASETPTSEGFYTIKGSEIIVYPTPLNNVTGGLTQEVILNLKDLTTSSIESDIFATSIDPHSELRQYHYIIGLGIAADIFGMKGMFDEKNQLETEFRTELQNMLSIISDRYATPIEGKLLNTEYFK